MKQPPSNKARLYCLNRLLCSGSIILAASFTAPVNAEGYKFTAKMPAPSNVAASAANPVCEENRDASASDGIRSLWPVENGICTGKKFKIHIRGVPRESENYDPEDFTIPRHIEW